MVSDRNLKLLSKSQIYKSQSFMETFGKKYRIVHGNFEKLNFQKQCFS